MPVKNFHLILSFFSRDLREKIVAGSQLQSLPGGTLLLEQGQRVSHIPFVLKGALRVFTRHEEKDLLLYYVKASESCIMSFASCLSRERSTVCAQAVEHTDLLLIPSALVTELVNTEPAFNLLFHRQYQARYQDLLGTITNLVFTNLDERLYHFIKEAIAVGSGPTLLLSHREIAAELGTAREVVTRLLKKLEREGKIIQKEGKISLFR
jgi:CRP/FNR family transcriptional regulator, anaerobic regulatory protein